MNHRVWVRETRTVSYVLEGTQEQCRDKALKKVTNDDMVFETGSGTESFEVSKPEVINFERVADDAQLDEEEGEFE